ncbi:MAG: hypothetical protein ACR2ND_10575 [Solirubrobacteraceae bacterium]
MIRFNPSNSADKASLDRGRQPQKLSRLKILDLLAQPRDSVVTNQSGLNRVSRMLDFKQTSSRLWISPGSHLTNAHNFRLARRVASQPSRRMATDDWDGRLQAERLAATIPTPDRDDLASVDR